MAYEQDASIGSRDHGTSNTSLLEIKNIYFYSLYYGESVEKETKVIGEEFKEKSGFARSCSFGVPLAHCRFQTGR